MTIACVDERFGFSVGDDLQDPLASVEPPLPVV